MCCSMVFFTLRSKENQVTGSCLIKWLVEANENLKGVPLNGALTQQQAEYLIAESSRRKRSHKDNSALYGDKPTEPNFQPSLLGPPTAPILTADSEVIIEIPDAFRGMAAIRGISAEEYLAEIIGNEVARIREILKAL